MEFEHGSQILFFVLSPTPVIFLKKEIEISDIYIARERAFIKKWKKECFQSLKYEISLKAEGLCIVF